MTLLGQNVNSYGRDLQLAARQAGDESARLRPLFADLLRAVGAVDGIRRVRFTSPHPKDMRPETFAAMAETPAVCEHLHYPLQSGSDRVLAADAPGLHRRALPRASRRRRVASSPTWPCRPTSSSGFPGETEADFQRTMEVAAAAEYDYAYMFIFSPRAGTEAAGMEARLRRPGGGRANDSRRLRVVVERAALRQARGPGRPDRGSPRRGSEQARSVGHERAHPSEQARPLHAAHAPAHRQLRHGRDHARRAAPPGRATSSSCSPSRPTACASPSPPSDAGPARPCDEPRAHPSVRSLIAERAGRRRGSRF